MKQAVNTQKLIDAVTQLRQTDSYLSQQISQLQKRASQLESHWKSSAGDTAIRAMYQLLENDTSRSAVLQNYITFLNQVAVPGMISAEDTNSKLSDLFK